jgi:hypothetical protein
MTDHITSDEIFETPEEIVALLRANAEQHRESSPCFHGLLNRAADMIERQIAMNEHLSGEVMALEAEIMAMGHVRW